MKEPDYTHHPDESRSEEDGWFAISYVTLEDVRGRLTQRGLRLTKRRAKILDKLDAVDMRQLADFIGEQLCEQDVFWNCIDEYLHSWGVTK